MSEFETRILGRLSKVSSKNIYVNKVNILIFHAYKSLKAIILPFLIHMVPKLQRS